MEELEDLAQGRNLLSYQKTCRGLLKRNKSLGKAPEKVVFVKANVVNAVKRVAKEKTAMAAINVGDSPRSSSHPRS